MRAATVIMSTRLLSTRLLSTTVVALLALNRVFPVTTAIEDRFVPPHVDFEYPDALCGTAWRDDYIRLHSAIRAASAAAYNSPPPSPPPPPPPPPPAPSQGINAPSPSSLAPLLSSAAPLQPAPPPTSPPLPPPASAPAPSPTTAPLPPSSPRFLTFDQPGPCGGFGDFLVGVVSLFAVALLDRRAFIIRHDCLPYAFEPAFIDWRESPDVPLEPSYQGNYVNGTFPEERIPRINLHDQRVDLQEFAKLKAFRNVRVLWNRGMLTEILTRGTGEWADALRATGLRPPYAFGCILRFLVRPRKEIWPLMEHLLHEMQGARTVTVGVHVRLNDGVIKRDNVSEESVNATTMLKALRSVNFMLDCARAVEDMWYPPPLSVRWMLITNSIHYKMAVRENFPGKVLETNFVPHHSAEFGQKGDPKEVQGFREMVADWLLLSRSRVFVIMVSGFSRTAAMFSLRPTAIFTPPKHCDPETPYLLSDFGLEYSGI
ncbi:hypothetical protein CLOM_g6666 [Closterium sp. NIES-68]|nr:hypothetical protein CLOM_g6666 [Closterium sp. NIES-68]